MTAIVLASRSPRRRQLLEQLGVEFDVVGPDVDERPRRDETPLVYVERVARAKAAAVATPADARVIAADTTVDVDGGIVGKPTDAADARRILRRLSGRAHHVHTGVAVRRQGKTESAVASTLVQFEALSEETIEWYLATGEPFDKAGAYALQGTGGVLVARVSGSVSNVVGLPLSVLVALARRLGVELAG